jgi:hypothetical protein
LTLFLDIQQKVNQTQIPDDGQKKIWNLHIEEIAMRVATVLAPNGLQPQAALTPPTNDEPLTQ